MKLFNLFSRRRSAPVARERLQILLTHERSAAGQSDLIAVLREDVLAAVAKHIVVDPDKVDVKLENGLTMSVLEIGIEVPKGATRRTAAKRPKRRAA